MEEIKSKIFGINIIGVLVDDYDGKDCSGRIVHQYSDEEIPFRTLMEMMGKMEHQFDVWNYPEAALESRSFFQHRRYGVKRSEKRMEDFLTHIALYNRPKSIEGKQGQFATFRVLVQMRQNATWQGAVHWVDQDKYFKFRSALEFVRYMDNALYEMV